MRIKRILVPTDLSGASMPAEDLAADLARTLDAEVLLLFCAEPLDATSVLTASEVASFLQEQDKAARAELERRALRMGKRAPRVQSLVVAGMASSAIIEAARKLGADLIVIGTHGRTGFSRFMIGSVAERVVRTAPCPVLTVRSSRARTRFQRAVGRRSGRRIGSRRGR
ncbi:MAG TPA: universal stress protein [Candidatus Binatia bacterium]|nr:universal stress protein [Candidatus Binatia bacterium]